MPPVISYRVGLIITPGSKFTIFYKYQSRKYGQPSPTYHRDRYQIWSRSRARSKICHFLRKRRLFRFAARSFEAACVTSVSKIQPLTYEKAADRTRTVPRSRIPTRVRILKICAPATGARPSAACLPPEAYEIRLRNQTFFHDFHTHAYRLRYGGPN